MVSYHSGYLYIAEENGAYGELFNHARTAAYLEQSSALGCGRMSNILADGGCAAYNWAPEDPRMNVILTEDGEPIILEDESGYLLTDDPLGWNHLEFGTTVDAPWYNPAYPESAQALGFWVTEWTGLDSGHVKRQSTAVGAYRGGSVLGAVSNSGRVMGFEVILFGESEAALEYLFRWLDSTVSSVCHTCATDTIIIRRYCPDISLDTENLINGVAEIRGVGLIDGVTWSEPPVENQGCFIRRVNFTMEATDPCMYSPCTEETVDQIMAWNDCFAEATLSPTRTQCRPSCSEMDPDCRTVYNFTVDTVGASAPVVYLSSPGPAIIDGATVNGSIPIRIRTYANPLGLDASQICGAPLLAELYVTSLPSYTDLVYDMAGRSVKVRNAGTGGLVNGFAYVAPNEPGVPRFPALGCGQYTVIVEPSDYCVTREPAPTTWGFETAVYTFASASPYLFVGGTTSVANDVTVENMAAFNRTNGMLWPTFNIGGTVGTSSSIRASAIQPDGKIIIGGLFPTARGVTVNRITRLLANGAVDPTWDITGTPGANLNVFAIAIQADGKIIIGGSFVTARGTTRNGIARLNTDGTLDGTFNTGGTVGVGGGGATVNAIAIQADGKIIIAGDFTTARGTTRNNIARLNTDGTLDGTFNTGGTVGVNGIVHALALQPDGQVIVGGAFVAARGTTRNGLARLATDGSLDATFNTGGSVGVSGGSATVFAIALQLDGRIIIGGSFVNARGIYVGNVARLSLAGAFDGHFVFPDIPSNEGVGAAVYAVTLDGSDIYLGGIFTTVGLLTPRPRSRWARYTDSPTNPTLDNDFPNSQLLPNGIGIPTIELALQERLGCA